MVRKAYPSDLTEAEWYIAAGLLPASSQRGRPRQVCRQEVLNAIYYVLRSGCAWRMLPHDFPPWQTVYYYFRKWRDAGTWERLNDALRIQARVAEGHTAQPSAAVLDSQSVKTTEVPGERGYDAGKQVNGRKGHILVDTLGLLLSVVVHAAHIQDRDGAKHVLWRVQRKYPRLKRIWADGSYRGTLIDWVLSHCGWILEIVQRKDEVEGFHVLPKRWIVERTLAWFGRYRRLSKDYEGTPESSQAFILAAMPHLMLRRLTAKPLANKLRKAA